MGSLPNLHELEQHTPLHFRAAPALGHLCPGPAAPHPPPLSPAEKSKILHRYSGHARIKKARSNGAADATKIVFDDYMLEQMATYTEKMYSPPRHHPAVRRRDSLSSSIGATSVRRLLGVVRPAHARHRPARPHSQRHLLANLLALCVAHLASTAALLPFLTLQASVSVWPTPAPARLGSLLLAAVHLLAAGGALAGPGLVRALGANVLIPLAYLLLAAFYLSHLAPLAFVLAPLCLALGPALGALPGAQLAFLMTLAGKVAFLAREDDDEEARALRRTCVVRRVARAFQAAHDFGLIVGSVGSALIVAYTISWSNREAGGWGGGTNGTAAGERCMNDTGANCTGQWQDAPVVYDYNAFLDQIFDRFEDERLCGAQACPPAFQMALNESEAGLFRILPQRTMNVLVGVYGALALVAMVVSGVGLDRMQSFVYQEQMEGAKGLAALRAVRDSFRDVRLRMAAPLALFIGMEQAFMYADFSKSYVICTLGIHRLNLVFLAMGLLQSIAACTLSMLLRSIRRYYVVAVGFTFHACLLMVLVLWKPIEDDPALFYVISASWGVCNAIWEMLNFTLLTGLYSEHWEAPFANSTFFRLLGMSIAFFFHGFICNYCKLYALGVFLVAAVVPFAWLEVRLENMRKVKNIIRL